MRRISLVAFLSFSLLSGSALAADESWVGELYNIVPNNTHVTEDYCKSHSLSTYKTTPQDQVKVVVADNGVKAEDIGSSVRKEGGVYFHTASVRFSGELNGKKWEEKANFFYTGLTKDSPLQGVWYSKNCKGFYRSNPA